MSAGGESRDPSRVRALFGSIARRYDVLNHVLSLAFDVGWRRRTARELPWEPGARVLDLCGGTGDLSVAIARSGRAGLVVCCDFATPMLRVAGEKFRRKRLADRCLLVEADALRLPFAEGTFDAVTVGFGVRNLADLDAGLREILRVLRPGGCLLVLEFNAPTAPVLSSIYRAYLRRVLPVIGDAASRRSGAYGYLARTIAEFPDPRSLAKRLGEAGFAAVTWFPLTGGIVCLHRAVKAGA